MITLSCTEGVHRYCSRPTTCPCPCHGHVSGETGGQTQLDRALQRSAEDPASAGPEAPVARFGSAF